MFNLCHAIGQQLSDLVEADVFAESLSYSFTSPFRSFTDMAKIFVGPTVQSIAANMFADMPQLEEVFFQGKTLSQVRAMANYPWGVDEGKIRVA